MFPSASVDVSFEEKIIYNEVSQKALVELENARK